MSTTRRPNDPETGDTGSLGLYNDQVDSFSWSNIRLSIEGKDGGRHLLSDVSGSVRAGQLVAIMGPSGSGKTTLLNVLAHRSLPRRAKVSGDIYINSTRADLASIRQTSTYVEQEDHLIGSITASETLAFAAKLGLKHRVTKDELERRVDHLLRSFGLKEQADVIIGTPIQKGLSGGQKRRTSVASQLITSPRILFLDEPTSGLDSVASYEVMSYLKSVAQENQLIVIASIHQPSTRTFNVFDDVYLMAGGHLCYRGPVASVSQYFESVGMQMPALMNPAEWMLELVNVDFNKDREQGQQQLASLVAAWADREPMDSTPPKESRQLLLHSQASRLRLMQPVHLLHRSFIKSYRDIVAYWIRVAMYTCLAFLMGTCWLRLGQNQTDIMPRITALFFSGAFLSFMAVAYIPAYIEDQSNFFKERANGLYGSTTFLVANFLIGLPYLFLIVSVFSVVAYWLAGFTPDATHFFRFVGFLVLDLLAAESLVVFVASALPNFVVSLAVVAFANGLWMCTNGFLVPETTLNVFWRSWVTKIDYQNWVFRALMVNEFESASFGCGTDGYCMYPAAADGRIPGSEVLAAYGYTSTSYGAWAGYLIAIIITYRLLALFALAIRQRA